jgi:hypothetical protein
LSTEAFPKQQRSGGCVAAAVVMTMTTTRISVQCATCSTGMCTPPFRSTPTLSYYMVIHNLTLEAGRQCPGTEIYRRKALPPPSRGWQHPRRNPSSCFLSSSARGSAWRVLADGFVRQVSLRTRCTGRRSCEDLGRKILMRMYVHAS